MGNFTIELLYIVYILYIYTHTHYIFYISTLYIMFFIIIMSVSEKQTDKFDIKNMQYLEEKNGMWMAFPNLQYILVFLLL